MEAIMAGLTWIVCLFVSFLCISCELPGHLKPLGHHRKPEGGVTILEDFPSPVDFYENYLAKSQPFVVKGVLKNGQFPAYKLWTDKYLNEKYGKIYVDVEGGKKEDRNANQYVMPLSTFLKIYNQSSIYMVYDVATDMKDDITVPVSLQCGGLQNVISTVITWFSSGGTKSVLHNDGLDNINCLLDGSKDLIMYHKKYKKEIEANDFVRRGAYSNVNVEAVDMEKFPKMSDLPWYLVNITKGDCLFIPYQWYHHVNSHSGRNLAINIWSNHVRWFNKSDCEAVEGKLQPKSLKSFKLAGMDDDSWRTVFVDYIFPDIDEVSREEFHDRLQKNTVLDDETINNIFESIDEDKDDVLTMREFHVFSYDELARDLPEIETMWKASDQEESEEPSTSYNPKEPRVIEMDDDVSFLIKNVDEMAGVRSIKDEL